MILMNWCRGLLLPERLRVLHIAKAGYWRGVSVWVASMTK